MHDHILATHGLELEQAEQQAQAAAANAEALHGAIEARHAAEPLAPVIGWCVPSPHATQPELLSRPITLWSAFAFAVPTGMKPFKAGAKCMLPMFYPTFVDERSGR